MSASFHLLGSPVSKCLRAGEHAEVDITAFTHGNSFQVSGPVRAACTPALHSSPGQGGVWLHTPSPLGHTEVPRY